MIIVAPIVTIAHYIGEHKKNQQAKKASEEKSSFQEVFFECKKGENGSKHVSEIKQDKYFDPKNYYKIVVSLKNAPTEDEVKAKLQSKFPGKYIPMDNIKFKGQVGKLRLFETVIRLQDKKQAKQASQRVFASIIG